MIELDNPSMVYLKVGLTEKDCVNDRIESLASKCRSHEFSLEFRYPPSGEREIGARRIGECF